jgi:hypothetical protein
MDYEDITEFSAETSTGKIKVRIMSLSNGLIVLISDSDQFRLGLTASAIPAGPGGSGPASSVLFSREMDSTSLRTLAERIAVWSNQTCLLILGISATLNNERIMELTVLLKNHFVV